MLADRDISFMNGTIYAYRANTHTYTYPEASSPQLSDFRPIFILSLFLKAQEKIIYDQIIEL